MRKPYFIKKVKHSQYTHVILATSWENPLAYLSDLYSELKGKPKKILIELLLCNGNSTMRFLEIDFDGARFQKATAKYIEGTKELRQYIVELINEDPNILDHSVLNSEQKSLLGLGVSI